MISPKHIINMCLWEEQQLLNGSRSLAIDQDPAAANNYMRTIVHVTPKNWLRMSGFELSN